MDFAMTVFELEPGESFSGAPHKHLNQEELFYITEGTATWHTKADAGAEPEVFEVGAGEVVHFAADDVFQTGVNESDGVVKGFAMGVPGSRHEWEKALGLVDCPECGDETVHTFRVVEGAADVRMPDPEEMVIACRECGNEL
ncbi:cupin domain-containing protein [Halobaculum litoreum]|uniref:Cupin domain-containing protein n=2 Tax=Halobaculum litoreum TaxID=3031998 RepID=A0ABD5XRC7_9EURY